MAQCPNRKRKRVGLGGGIPGCDGSVVLVVRPAITIDLKRIPRGGDGFQAIVKSGVRKRGMKIAPVDLERCYAEGKFDIYCPKCGWRLSACRSGVAARKSPKKKTVQRKEA